MGEVSFTIKALWHITPCFGKIIIRSVRKMNDQYNYIVETKVILKQIANTYRAIGELQGCIDAHDKIEVDAQIIEFLNLFKKNQNKDYDEIDPLLKLAIDHCQMENTEISIIHALEDIKTTTIKMLTLVKRK
jgi:hypothetical protein